MTRTHLPASATERRPDLRKLRRRYHADLAFHARVEAAALALQREFGGDLLEEPHFLALIAVSAAESVGTRVADQEDR